MDAIDVSVAASAPRRFGGAFDRTSTRICATTAATAARTTCLRSSSAAEPRETRTKDAGDQRNSDDGPERIVEEDEPDQGESKPR